MLGLLLASSATALATGLGVLPLWWLGDAAAAYQPLLYGIAAGVMGVASVEGLLIPGLDDGPASSVWAGLAAGALLLWGIRRMLAKRHVHAEKVLAGGRTSLLVFAVLFVHSLPEGFAVGTAYASGEAGLGTFVIIAIAVQNIPEGTSVGVPMALGGASRAQQFWTAVATSSPQPVGAVLAYLLTSQVASLLPFSFGFAAGAMLALIVVELAPAALRSNPLGAFCGAAIGALAMLGLSAVLSV